MRGADAHHSSGSWRNLVITVWRKETELEAVRRMEQTMLQLLVSYPGGVGLLIVIESGAKLPSDAAREAIASTMRKLGDQLLGCGYVAEGDGFASAAVRYVIIGLIMLARPTYKYTIVKTVPDVARWMAAQVTRAGQEVSPGDITRAVETLRSGSARPTQHVAGIAGGR